MRIYSWCRMSSYYAVACGRKIGIFSSWIKCEEQVKGFKGAKYKKFPTHTAAEAYIDYHTKSRNRHSNENKLLKKSENIDEKDFWPNNTNSFHEGYLNDEDLVQAVTAFDNANALKESSKQKKCTNEDFNCVRRKYIGNYSFQVDNEGFVLVYTDGSCLRNGQTNPCAGYGVWFGENHPLNIGAPVIGRVTNNTGEIQAAAAAIRIAKEASLPKLCICTDSQFLIKSVTVWMKTWKKRNWTLKNGKYVKNMADFRELDNLLHDINTDIKWVVKNYVRAHKGIIGNEMADRLAKKGSELHHCYRPLKQITE